MNRFQKLAVATAGVTILLFSVGGLVRGTDSGLGCSTWPNCTPGVLFPSGTIHSLIEFSHRFLVFVVTVLALGDGVPRRARLSANAAAAVARGRRGPPRAGAGRARRHRGPDRSRPLVGDGPFRGGAGARGGRRLPRGLVAGTGRGAGRRAGRIRPVLRATGDVDGRGHRRPAARGDLRPGPRRGPRLRRLAAHGRAARPHAGRGGDPDVRPPCVGGASCSCSSCGWRSGRGPWSRRSRDLVALSTLALGAVRGSDPRRRGQRVDASAARGSGRPRRAVGADLEHHRRAGRRREAVGRPRGRRPDRARRRRDGRAGARERMGPCARRSRPTSS